jgi:hypothetical protein
MNTNQPAGIGQRSFFLPTARLLAAGGAALFLIGYALQYMVMVRIKRGGQDWDGWSDVNLGLLLLSLLCWVIAPFFCRCPLWLKVILSVLSVIVWAALGKVAVFFAHQAFNLPAN